MTENAKNFLLQTAAIIKMVRLENHIYRRREDFYLSSDLDAFRNRDYKSRLNMKDFAELYSKPQLMECHEYTRNADMIRITKKGWETAKALAYEVATNAGATVYNEDDLWTGIAWDIA